jgi:tetratricopeptide (TPR) repeat protein
MGPWQSFDRAGAPHHDASSLTQQWHDLHRGDAEPLPQDPALLEAWLQYHNGAFDEARLAGMALGWRGAAVVLKATCVYAVYLEPRESARLSLLQEAADYAVALQQHLPACPAGWYGQAYALGRFSQGISVAKALTQGLGQRIQTALRKTIELEPRHADAHLALATFHAELIDKVGPLIGSLTHGASRHEAMALYAQALQLNPDAAIALNEYANGLLMLEGEARLPQVTALQERVAAMGPRDAMECLYLEAAGLTLDE